MEQGRSFVAILEEAAGAAVPGTAAAMEQVRARLEEIRAGWPGEAGGAERAGGLEDAVGMELEELLRMKRGLRQVQRLVEHAARRRLGLLRQLTAQEMGYTASGELASPAATSWECVG
ncbi:MAG: hypothetical protein J0L64_03375 [Acidobacteria bacterium]|nr:hypothetical protein [Acidobacteriota bacterium]